LRSRAGIPRPRAATVGAAEVSMSRTHDLLFLFGLSTLAIACDEGGGEHRDEVDAAVDICVPFAERVTSCYGEEYESYFLAFVGSCVASLGYGDYVGSDCRAAQEDYFACAAEMDCSELKSEDDPCSEESDAMEETCDVDDASEDDDDEE
jgi:hypothetical protein